MIGTLVKNRRSWRAKAMIRGKLYDKTFKSRAVAVLFLKKLEVDRDMGTLGVDLPRPRMKFDELVGLYRAEQKHRLAASTMSSYNYRLDANLLPELGKLQVLELRPATVDGYITKRLAGGASAADVAHDRMLLGAVLSWAYDHDFVNANPVRRTKKLRYAPTRGKRALTDEEIARSVAVLSPASRLAFLFAVYTGARASEQCRVEWKHVDLVAGSVRLESLGRAHTKTYKGRDVPLHPALAGELAKAPRRGRFVFAGARGESRGRDFRGILERTVAEAKLEPYVWHDLRHTFATRLRRAGASLEDIAELLGHSSITSTLIYAHADDTKLRTAVLQLPTVPAEVLAAAPPEPKRRRRRRVVVRHGRQLAIYT